MDPRIESIEKAQLKSDRPPFRVGDVVRVYVRITEEEKTRIQPFEGVVIARKGGSLRETFTVRRISYGEAVERNFLLHSPFIEKILVIKHGNVRRAKLYYLRKKVGKSTRIPSKESPQCSGDPPKSCGGIGGSANPSGGEERFEKTSDTPSVRPEAPAPTKA